MGDFCKAEFFSLLIESDASRKKCRGIENCKELHHYMERKLQKLLPKILVMGQTPFYRTSNELECVHLLVIEHEHPIFGFERMNIEHQALYGFL